MLVYRPTAVLCKLFGYDIVMRSDDQTQDMTKFDADVKKAREVIENLVKEIK